MPQLTLDKSRIYSLFSGISVLPWFLGVTLAFILFMFMLSIRVSEMNPEESVTIRKVQVALPPPPPPPPIKMERPENSSSTPSLDLLGVGEGPSLTYSDMPEIGFNNMEKVERPDFDISQLDLRSTLSVDFPILKVENLDSIPRALSYRSNRFPSALVSRGITRVETKVELVIDQRGRAYIKKIVDPVYPEMVEIIRAWVKSVRFSVPTKNGQPVLAVYLYTLIFNYRM